MANPQRGEIEATLDGEPVTLCLTLGALAELEASFEATDIIEVVERLQGGRVRAGDLINIITAGLRGAGRSVTRDEVAAMHVDGGVKGAVTIAARLLEATFKFTAPGHAPREDKP